VWQALYAELKDRNFVVIAVALDSRPGDAEKWIAPVNPGYPVLLDRQHRVAELYHMVNVPQAVWIDEQGKIVRPAESAGYDNAVKVMDRTTGKLPEDAAAHRAATKSHYYDAVRDWVRNGSASEYAFDARAAQAHLRLPTANESMAHAMFRLGQALISQGQATEGDDWLRRASELHPESWAIWRQRAGLDHRGLAALPDFWERVEARGGKPYHLPIDMKGMPG
jgi:hypothetical protein